MKNKLGALGYVIVVILIYLISTGISSFLFVTYYHLQYGPCQETAPLSLEEFLFQNAAPMTVLGGVFALVLFGFLLKATRRGLVNFCRFRKASRSHLLVAVVTGAGLSFFLVGLVELLDLERFFPEHQENMEALLEPGLLVSLLTVGLFIPFYEEIMFRGLIFNRLLQEFPPVAVLIIQAFIFALIHWNVLQSGYTFIGGIILGLALLWSGTIWVPVLIHAGWNSASVLLNNLLVSEPGTTGEFFLLISGLIILIAGLVYFKNKYHQGLKENSITG